MNLIVLTIVLMEGFSRISSDLVPLMAMRSQKYFQEVGVKVRMQTLQIEDLGCGNSNIDKRLDEAFCYYKARKSLALKGRSLTYFLVRGWENEKGQNYYGGMALGLCGSTAIGTAYPTDVGVILRDEFNGDILAHEILHTMCATHTEPMSIPSIMSVGFWNFWKPGETLPILDITKRQVLRWKSKFRRLAK